MINKIKSKIKSDTAAIGSTETVLLIALSVFAVMVVYKYIMVPIQESSKGIGQEIKEMNPKKE